MTFELQVAALELEKNICTTISMGSYWLSTSDHVTVTMVAGYVKLEHEYVVGVDRSKNGCR